MISSYFNYSKGEFYCEDVPLTEIVQRAGTPAYIYSANGLRAQASGFMANLPDACDVKYAMKANWNSAIIRIFCDCGFGTEIVSAGELQACRMAGVSPESILFGGMGKTKEILGAAISAGVGMISLDSEPEISSLLDLLDNRTCNTRFLVRCNPNIDGITHPYLTTGREDNKFGVDIARVLEMYRTWQSLTRNSLCGLHFHVGSQIVDVDIFQDVCKVVIESVRSLRQTGAVVEVVDLGGGLGVSYEDNTSIDLSIYKEAVRNLVETLNVRVVLEPGRFLVAENGIAVGSVLLYKEGRVKDFIVTDLALNDLLRPSLYDAFHEIVPVYSGQRPEASRRVDVVGPVCESGDFLGRDRSLPKLQAGDAVAVLTAGAYGFAMASNYNCRPKPVEILVEGRTFRVIRERQDVCSLI